MVCGVVAVAEAPRDNAERRGKIFCRPKMAFLRGNLVPRVVRRSSQFSAPIFGHRRRAPTNEGCHRSCPVHPDAWPDNREFLALEMEVVGRRAHIGAVKRPVSNRRTSHFRLLCERTNFPPPRLERAFDSLSKNSLTRDNFDAPPKGGSLLLSATNEGQFCPTIWRILGALM